MLSSSLELPREEFCSKKETEDEARDMTVGVELPASDCWCFIMPLLLSALSSDEMRAARTSGARDSHMSATDFGTVGETLMYSSLVLGVGKFMPQYN